MSGAISVSPAGRMPSFGLVWVFGAAPRAFADGDEQPAAAPSDTAAAMRSTRFIMMGTFYHFADTRHRKDLSLFFSVLYQSNFAPKRASRGGTIVDGVRKVAPELQLMFVAAFVFDRL